MLTKVCTKCGTEKEAHKDNFHWRNDRNLFASQCKLCRNAVIKDRYDCKKDVIKAQHKQYYYDNKETVQKRHKKYRTDNIEKCRYIERFCGNRYYAANKSKEQLRHKNYVRQRLLKDPEFKLRLSFSGKINKALQKVKANKGGQSCLDYLPYSMEELVTHIESQFESWMNWSNRGVYNSSTWNDSDPKTWTWNIDHIIPQSLLHYDSMKHPNFKKCWALENLRPLSAKTNVLDGVSRIRHRGKYEENNR